MKKTFVKPEMKSYKLRGNRILAGSGICPPVLTPQQCPTYCAYNCVDESCYMLTGGTCQGHKDYVN